MLQSTRFSLGKGGMLLIGLFALNACDEEEGSSAQTGGSAPVASAGMGGDDSTGGRNSSGSGGGTKTGGSSGAGGSKATGGAKATGGNSVTGGGSPDCDPTKGDDECTPEVIEPAATGKLNDTGANYCRELGVEEPVTCVGTGADGEFGRDVIFPEGIDGFAGFSYQKVCHSGEVAGSGNCPEDPELGSDPNDWGCTLDNVTGLLWEIKTNDGGSRDVSRVYSHRGATSSWDVSSYVSSVNAQGLCGGTDWRLPRADELESLVVYNTFVDPGTSQEVQFEVNWFPNTIRTVSEPGYDDSYEAAYWIVETGRFWQGEYYDSGWLVDFLRGSGSSFDRNDDDALFSVRLVRGAPQPYPTASRFEISTDGTEVTDLTTNLTWKRCAEGQTWDGSTCLGFATSMTIDDAFAWTDLVPGWRLANARELMSLYYISGGDNEGTLQLDEDVFPNSFGQLPHLTSTPVPWNAWYYYSIGTGRLPRDTSDSGIVRLVRE